MRPIKIERILPSKPLKSVLPACLLALLAACGSGDLDVTMERRGQTSLGRTEWQGVSSTSTERFGSREMASTGSGHAGAPAAPTFSYDVPEGWVEAPPTDLRMLNFKVAGRDDASCYLTALPGKAGGVLENVNHWRSQFGAAPLTEEQVKALPTSELFTLPAVRVEVSGPFSDGMGGSELSEGSLVGLIAQQDNTMAFLKMVGPADVIAQEIEHFNAFSTSLTFVGAPTQEQGPGPERTILHEAPAGWTVQGSKPMRQLGYDLPGGVDLSVTVLGGEAGGVAGNVNRWRGQMGLADVSEAELLAGERIDCFGESAYWVKFSGAYGGMSGETKGTQDTMMAVVVPMAKETIFVKCVGATAAKIGRAHV